jgi:hypothetical protein
MGQRARPTLTKEAAEETAAQKVTGGGPYGVGEGWKAGGVAGTGQGTESSSKREARDGKGTNKGGQGGRRQNV